MACKHEHLRCTDNVFYCLDCGEKVERENLIRHSEAATPSPKGKAAKKKPAKEHDE